MRSGIVGRQRFDVISRVTCSSTPPSLTPGRPRRPRARSRPRPGSPRRASPPAGRCARGCRAPGALLLLDHDRDRLARPRSRGRRAPPPARARCAHLALGDLERARLRAAAVDDARARARRGAGGGWCGSRTRSRGCGLERCASVGHRAGEDRERAAEAERCGSDACGPDADGRRVEDPEGQGAALGQAGLGRRRPGARYAGTKAANVARSEEGAQEQLEQRHLETAMKMVGALGQMKGAAMKLGQFASFIDTEFLRREYREIYQEQLAKLRTDGAGDALGEGREGARGGVRRRAARRSSSPRFEQEAFAAASIGQVHRASCSTAAPVAVKIQYPGIAEALESDLRNAGTIVRLARALAPGLDAKAIAEELRERVMEELDYEYEAQNQRTFARAYRDHPFIYVPDVLTRLSRRRVLVTEFVEGIDFERGQAARRRAAQPLRRDRLPLLLRLDLPPAALQRRPPPRQLHPDGRRPGRLPRLRDDEEARHRADRARAARRSTRRSRKDPEALREALHDLGFVKNPSKLDAERLMDHVMAGRRLVHGGPRVRGHRARG